MSLPFSPDQFFGVFADYNRAFWVVVIGSWLATATALIAARRNPSHRSRQLTYLLSALWMWSAVALLFPRADGRSESGRDWRSTPLHIRC
jgi:hypothetical protein